MGFQEELQVLLHVLVVQCKVEARSAMQVVPALIGAEVRTEEDLRGLSDAVLKKCVPDGKMRRKITVGLKKGKGASGGAKKKDGAGSRSRSAPKQDSIPIEIQAEEIKDKELKALDVVVNRSPVMILWATAVAQRRGFDLESALSLAQGAADWYAQKKGEYHGILSARSENESQEFKRENIVPIELVNVQLKARKHGPEGLRALDSSSEEIPPSKPFQYINRNFGDKIGKVYGSMHQLLAAMPLEEIDQGPTTYTIYERFRPDVPRGAAGWGTRSRLKMHEIMTLRDIYQNLIDLKAEPHEVSAPDTKEEPLPLENPLPS